MDNNSSNKEQVSLSKKIAHGSFTNVQDFIRTKDVKEKINEFIDGLKEYLKTHQRIFPVDAENVVDRIDKLALEKFGKEILNG